MKFLRPLFAVLLVLFLFVGVVVFAQEEKTPPATTSQEVRQAPQKFDRVDRNKNKILDALEEQIREATPEAGFDVIVMAEKSIDEILPTLKSRHGEFSETFTYPSINGFATNLTKGQVIAISADADIKLVEFDAPVFAHLDSANNWFGTAKARADFGVDGNADGQATYSKDDIVVAVIDTGIDTTHVDLDGGKIIAWEDFTPNNQPNPYDETNECVGHGTHVSSIAAGEGEADPNFKGVAPKAALVGLKVLREQNGDCVGQTSWVEAAIQWIITNKTTYSIEVANLSLGIAGCSDGNDSTSQLVNQAVDAGVVVTVSAGNEGPTGCTIGSPAAAEKAITVGAAADVDPGSSASGVCSMFGHRFFQIPGDLPGKGFYLACFSSRGPTADGRTKPDIASPGVFIKAAAAGTTNGYKNLTGTSMSSPFAAGVAALVLHANSALTPTQVKQKIGDTAQDWGPSGKDVDYGFGRLQGYEAVKSAGSRSEEHT